MFYGNETLEALKEQKISEELFNENYNPNFEEDFYNEFYNAYWALNNEVEFYSLLEAQGNNALLLPDSQHKESIGDKIKHLINIVVTWIKEAFKKLAQVVKNMYEKIVYNTVRDKALQAIFKNYSYDDTVKARENGWKGVPRTYKMPAFADIKQSRIYDYYSKYTNALEDKNLTDLLSDMEMNQTAEYAEDKYNEILDVIKDNKKDFHLKYSKFVSSLSVGVFGNSDYGAKEGDKYFYPMKHHFEILQNIVLNSQQRVVYLKKSYDKDFKKITSQKVFDYNTELKQVKSEKDTSDNEGHKVYSYYLKAKIAVCKYELELARNIIKDTITRTITTFKYAFSIYLYIVATTRRYLSSNTAKGKNPEPAAAAS